MINVNRFEKEHKVTKTDIAPQGTIMKLWDIGKQFAKGEITEAEIIGNGWTASLIDGGGFNCRHKWEIASTEGKGFSEQSKVEGQRKENAR